MDPPFTKINLSMFFIYQLFLPLVCRFGYKGLPKQINRRYVIKILDDVNKFLGAVTFNTSCSILLGYESARCLYPHAADYMKKQITKKHNISGLIYEFIDFITHIFPIIYLLTVSSHWEKYSGNRLTVLFSLFIQGTWVRLVPNHYNMNRVYMYGNNDILKDHQWKTLCSLAILGHFIPYGIKNLIKI